MSYLAIVITSHINIATYVIIVGVVVVMRRFNFAIDMSKVSSPLTWFRSYSGLCAL